MYRQLKSSFLYCRASFRGSSTILVARFNVAIGCAWTALLGMDPQMLSNIVPALKNPQYLAAWIMANGFLTEYARRRPATGDPLPPVAAGFAPTDGPVKS